MLKDLLLSTSSNENMNDDFDRAALIKESLEQAAATFTRLRDPKIPADDKTDDVQRACETSKKVEGLVEVCSHPNRMNTTDRHIRTSVATDAAQLIPMMQKFHRVDHAAIAVIALAPVRELCGTTMPFVYFVLGTAKIFVSVDRQPQAREVLDVLEKRLLKTPFAQREPPKFHELVQTYSSARKDMGLGRTFSSDSFRSLEWYISNAVENYEQETELDNMVGNPFYVEFTPADSRHNHQLELAINAELPQVVCFHQRVMHIMYGGKSEDDVERAREVVLRAAGRISVRLATHNAQPCTRSVRFGPFVFSATGVVRDGVAA